MTIPYLAMLLRVISLYVTPLTDPVAPETVLIRTPLSESVMEELRMLTVFTTLSERPPRRGDMLVLLSQARGLENCKNDLPTEPMDNP